MAKRKPIIPNYGTVQIKGKTYYRTRLSDDEGNRIPLYAATREELYEKVNEVEEQIENKTFRRQTPTVREYCEKWLLMKSANIRETTMIDYRSKVKNHIIKPLGDMKMGDVTADDIRLAVIPASKLSSSVFKSVNVLYKCIFRSALESKVIDKDPTRFISVNGGGIPQNERTPLTDEQVEKLLAAIKGLPPYLFVMLGLYAGLRREEILGLKWDSVYLNIEAPYLTVRRAWHTENNRPVILTELKTKAAKRNIPIPPQLVEALREAKSTSESDYVVANRDGQPLSYTQFQRLWKYITTRTAKPRPARKLVNGKYVKYTLYPVLGEKARNNGHVVYSLDFDVTPHQLRHTYITNLIYASVDPKTVQYLAGHENSKITMDIYAKAKYNRPEDVAPSLEHIFNQWNEAVSQ
jgi:integrase